jgi:DNA-binding MarR family transcriptional regulator
MTAVQELGEPAVRVLRRFRQVFNAVKTHFQQVEKRAGIGGAQLWALSLVQAHPGIGVGALSRGMDVHQSTASNLVKTLSALGLLEARKGGADRRAVQLHLLPAGERVLQTAPGPFAGVLPQALAHLDAQTLNRLEQDLTTLIDQLQTTEKDAGIPLGHG